MANVDRRAFEEVCDRLDKGEQLTFEGIGDIFGKTFWIMLVYSLMDAQDAARAIQNAILNVKIIATREAMAEAEARKEEVPSVITTD